MTAGSAPSRRSTDSRTSLLLFEGAVAFFVGYVLLRGNGYFFPSGSVGHPRGTPIESDWSVPWSLTVFQFVAIAVLAMTPRMPLVGISSYFAVLYFFQVQSPEWIYTRAIRLPFVLALLTIAGTAVWRNKRSIPNRVRLANAIKNPALVAFLSFLSWYLVCCFTALFGEKGFAPALQYHPIHLLESLLLSTAVIAVSDRKRTFEVLSLSIAATLFLRVMVNGLEFRDAGIARDISMALPLLAYFSAASTRWWGRILAMVICFSGLCCLIEVENRGSFIGLAFALVAFFATGKHFVRSVMVGIPFVCLLALGVMQTRMGARFNQVLDQPDLWQSNKRLVTWRGGLDIAYDHWVFGIGPGNFVHWIGDYAPDVNGHSAHHLLVDILSETGFVGFALFGGLMFLVTRQCYRNIQRGCTVSRWVLIGLAAWVGNGMMLTTTMLALPYVLIAVSVSGRVPVSGHRRLQRESLPAA